MHSTCGFPRMAARCNAALRRPYAPLRRSSLPHLRLTSPRSPTPFASWLENVPDDVFSRLALGVMGLRRLVEEVANRGNGFEEANTLNFHTFRKGARKACRHHRVEHDKNASVAGTAYQPTVCLFKTQPGQHIVIRTRAERLPAARDAGSWDAARERDRKTIRRRL